MAEKQKKFFSESVKFSLMHFLTCVVLYFTIALAFRTVLSVFPVSEIQPADGLPPVLGIIFGIPGVLGCVVARFVYKLLIGLPIAESLLGIPICFIYGWVPALCWNFLTKKNPEDRLKINSTEKLVIYIFIAVVISILNSVCVGVANHILKNEKIFSDFMRLCIKHDLFFIIVLGLPAFVGSSLLKQYENQKNKAGANIVQFSIIERIILYFSCFAIIFSVSIGTKDFITFKSVIANSLTLANKLFTSQIIFISIELLLLIHVVHYAERHIVRPLEKMIESAKFQEGNKNLPRVYKKVAETYRDYIGMNSEIGTLARAYISLAYNAIENSEKANLSGDKVDYEKDIIFANQIQKTLLPQIFPTFTPCADVDVFGAIKFAKDFGGDFYDFFLVDETHLAIMIADVAGRGIEAALFLSIVKNLIKDKILAGLLPEEIFSDINLQFSTNNTAGLFVSVWLGLLDTESGDLIFVNAGQPQPLIMRKDEKCKMIESSVDLALGVSDETLYSTSKIQLEKGDKLVLYTKGITEAEDSFNEKYGTERLCKFFEKYREIEVQELVNGLDREIGLFVGSKDFENDMTVLALEYKKS